MSSSPITCSNLIQTSNSDGQTTPSPPAAVSRGSSQEREATNLAICQLVQDTLISPQPQPPSQIPTLQQASAGAAAKPLKPPSSVPLSYSKLCEFSLEEIGLGDDFFPKTERSRRKSGSASSAPPTVQSPAKRRHNLNPSSSIAGGLVERARQAASTAFGSASSQARSPLRDMTSQHQNAQSSGAVPGAVVGQTTPTTPRTSRKRRASALEVSIQTSSSASFSPRKRIASQQTSYSSPAKPAELPKSSPAKRRLNMQFDAQVLETPSPIPVIPTPPPGLVQHARGRVRYNRTSDRNWGHPIYSNRTTQSTPAAPVAPAASVVTTGAAQSARPSTPIDSPLGNAFLNPFRPRSAMRKPSGPAALLALHESPRTREAIFKAHAARLKAEEFSRVLPDSDSEASPKKSTHQHPIPSRHNIEAALAASSTASAAAAAVAAEASRSKASFSPIYPPIGYLSPKAPKAELESGVEAWLKENLIAGEDDRPLEEVVTQEVAIPEETIQVLCNSNSSKASTLKTIIIKRGKEEFAYTFDPSDFMAGSQERDYYYHFGKMKQQRQFYLPKSHDVVLEFPEYAPSHALEKAKESIRLADLYAGVPHVIPYELIHKIPKGTYNQIFSFPAESDQIMIVRPPLRADFFKTCLDNTDAFGGISQLDFLQLSLNIWRMLETMQERDIIHSELWTDVIFHDKDYCLLDLRDAKTAPFSGRDGFLGVPKFRAPELLLQVSHDYLIDTWSAGCILFEALTARGLIIEDHPRKEMREIVSILGIPPKELILASPLKDEYFVEKDGEFHWKYKDGESEFIPGAGMQRVKDLIYGPQKPVKDGTNPEEDSALKHPSVEKSLLDAFFDLFQKTIAYPSKRHSPGAILHDWRSAIPRVIRNSVSGQKTS